MTEAEPEAGPAPYSMLDWAMVESATMADGGELVLARHRDEWVVRIDSRVLMTNRMHDSEIALAEHAFDRVEDPRRVLVGGLGLGYTLRAVLELVSEDAEVTVVELMPELVRWNREYVGGLNDHPLDDPRCRVVVGDVFDTIKQSPREFDLMLLDVDNGPQALAQPKNQRLYGPAGVRACHTALREDGVLAVWSGNPNARFERRLESFPFDVEVVRVPARIGARAEHILFLAKRR